MSKYVIGVDFGTLSGRSVLVDTASGEEIADSEYAYPHAVMDEQLPDGTPLGLDWALQHPNDYLEVFYHTIPDVIAKSGVSASDIIGVGIDFTACTFLPIKRDGTPLCLLEQFRSTPNAYVKLWKHHAAQDKANLLNAVAAERDEVWLPRYGGKISSEWEVPKVMQVLEESPEVYEAADFFIEGADWVVWALTGNLTRNTCTAGYKGIWHHREGYPSKSFFKALDPRLENYVEEKLAYPMIQLGSKAGGITAEMAAKTGLPAGIAVAAGNVDAHVTVPAVKISGSGKMLAIIGTSTCHMVMSESEQLVPGMCGVVEGGILPGYFGYEAGQSCVGDHFAWFVENCCPVDYFEQAENEGRDIHELLTDKAEKLEVGESGLVALDWWNGNRSVLVDVDLTGLIVGMTLATRPEEIYRALIEATAYGTRKIIESLREHGVAIDAFYAAGGISQKNPLMMQIYADVIGLPVHIAGSAQGPALGSAIFAAVAAGKDAGGYDDIFSAADRMGKLNDRVYDPVPANQAVYEMLYAEYNKLHDFFGRGGNDVMKRLKQIRKDAKA